VQKRPSVSPPAPTVRAARARERAIATTGTNDVNGRLPNGYTPLIVAAALSRTAAARVLLEHGRADPNLVDHSRDTALHHAVLYRYDLLAAPAVGLAATT
jgi:ankyrin repeat protein